MDHVAIVGDAMEMQRRNVSALVGGADVAGRVRDALGRRFPGATVEVGFFHDVACGAVCGIGTRLRGTRLSRRGSANLDFERSDLHQTLDG